jgi:hypothetical protein
VAVVRAFHVHVQVSLLGILLSTHAARELADAFVHSVYVNLHLADLFEAAVTNFTLHLKHTQKFNGTFN